MNDQQHRHLLQEKIRRTQHKLADAVESMVDRIAAETAPKLSLAAERRQYANLLGAAQFCARRACRRAQCCLGEPAECLRVCMPLVDGGGLAGLTAPRRNPRRAAKGNRQRR